MPSNDITFTVSAKDAGFIQQWLQFQQTMKQGAQQVDDFAAKGHKAGESIGSILQHTGKLGLELFGAASAMETFGKMTELASREFERFHSLRARIAESLLDVGQARQKALYASGLSEAQFQKLDPTIKGIAQSLGQEHAGPAYELAETALSGRGDLSCEYCARGSEARGGGDGAIG